MKKNTKKRNAAILTSFLLYFSSIPAHAAAAEQPNKNARKPLKEYCETAPCRKNMQFKLKKKDGTYFEYTAELTPPVVQPEFILIFPEETLFIEATEGKNAPIELKSVPENTHPERTIVFKFNQGDDAKTDTSMFLTVHNPFSRPLRYNLAMTPLEQQSKGLYKTSSCPVMAEGQVFEHWPYPIFQLIVSNMHFLKKSDDIMACRE